MASFNITGPSTTAQTLTTNENGVVGQTATLSVLGSSAIIVSGTASDVAIFGTVIAVDADALLGSTGSIDIFLGTSAQLASTAGDAIDMDISSLANVFNAGTIMAASRGLFVSQTDGNAAFFLNNSGTISAVSQAILAQVGTGTIRINNSGTIETTSTSGSMSLSAGAAEVRNAGTIFGDIFGVGVGTILNLRNTGTIHGSVTLDGAGTIDTRGGTVTGSLTGGEGNNTFRIDNDDISIADTGLTGVDTIFSSVTFTIASGIERLVLTGARDIRAIGDGFGNELTGNRGDNRLSGQFGNDTLDGGAGDDTLSGGSGDDVLHLDLGNDTLFGGSGIDTLQLSSLATGLSINLTTGIATGPVTDDDTLSGIENVTGSFGNDSITGNGLGNVLIGGFGDDSVSGGNGNDTIGGEAGADTLRGGGGADRFVFASFGASPLAAPDLIADFVVAQGDLIDLSGIDPDPGVNDQFVFNGTSFLPQGLPSVRVFQDAVNNITIIEARDTIGPEVDLRIHLTGLITLTAGEFLL